MRWFRNDKCDLREISWAGSRAAPVNVDGVLFKERQSSFSHGVLQAGVRRQKRHTITSLDEACVSGVVGRTSGIADVASHSPDVDVAQDVACAWASSASWFATRIMQANDKKGQGGFQCLLCQPSLEKRGRWNHRPSHGPDRCCWNRQYGIDQQLAGEGGPAEAAWAGTHGTGRCILGAE
ncbi:hypothetical protein LY76DRAFT_111453 [Colletotrichum caudatum]|nr:hypothetical protein LY76DRAFT_111453 [Colletotrichum caudatum]